MMSVGIGEHKQTGTGAPQVSEQRKWTALGHGHCGKCQTNVVPLM